MGYKDWLAAIRRDVRALGGRVAVKQADGDEIMLSPHEALTIAQSLIDAAAAAEGQKLLLRDIMNRSASSARISRH
jgi:hypothetical protein